VASLALTRPVSPLIAERSGRMIGSGKKVCASRPSRGRRPARRKLDFPDTLLALDNHAIG
jgi:hypothetical protein